MKANKAKTSKKAAKKMTKRAVKKQLETSITDKFLEALVGLGHDAGKLSKEIKKTSRVLANKLAEKYQEVKIAVEEKFESSPKQKRAKKPLTTAKRAVAAASVKAEKVVAQAAAALKAKATPKKPATARSTATRAAISKSTAAKPVSAKKTPVRSGTAGSTTASVKPAGARAAGKKAIATDKAAPVKKIRRGRKPSVSPASTPAAETSVPPSGNDSEN
ncbi:MAG: hypothetical protein ACYCZO_07595 [Daejeonella sp.]